MKEMKQHSIKYNFLMNFVLSASQFIFPLITFPYVSRVLLAEGSGKVTFVASVANYFSMVASLGIPTYGIRACAQVRDDRDKLSKTAHELLIINSITTLLVATVYKGNIIKNLIMDCQSYTKYRPNETTGGIFVSWRRKEELPTGA